VAMPDSERRAWVRILQRWLTTGRL